MDGGRRRCSPELVGTSSAKGRCTGVTTRTRGIMPSAWMHRRWLDNVESRRRTPAAAKEGKGDETMRGRFLAARASTRLRDCIPSTGLGGVTPRGAGDERWLAVASGNGGETVPGGGETWGGAYRLRGGRGRRRAPGVPFRVLARTGSSGTRDDGGRSGSELALGAHGQNGDRGHDAGEEEKEEKKEGKEACLLPLWKKKEGERAMRQKEEELCLHSLEWSGWEWLGRVDDDGDAGGVVWKGAATGRQTRAQAWQVLMAAATGRRDECAISDLAGHGFEEEGYPVVDYESDLQTTMSTTVR
uniref:Epstein-Barr virus EBNA-1-like n=1 Tax=Oryza sativa subsp. japonica TaxID=39947 RepID=Q658H2_ORYSJ|nr:Epstein-Barr virus EBNA-1-like [Oryza sativa Japonica Group]